MAGLSFGLSPSDTLVNKSKTSSLGGTIAQTGLSEASAESGLVHDSGQVLVKPCSSNESSRILRPADGI